MTEREPQIQQLTPPAEIGKPQPVISALEQQPSSDPIGLSRTETVLERIPKFRIEALGTLGPRHYRRGGGGRGRSRLHRGGSCERCRSSKASEGSMSSACMHPKLFAFRFGIKAAL